MLQRAFMFVVFNTWTECLSLYACLWASTLQQKVCWQLDITEHYHNPIRVSSDILHGPPVGPSYVAFIYHWSLMWESHISCLVVLRPLYYIRPKKVAANHNHSSIANSHSHNFFWKKAAKPHISGQTLRSLFCFHQISLDSKAWCGAHAGKRWLTRITADRWHAMWW